MGLKRHRQNRLYAITGSHRKGYDSEMSLPKISKYLGCAIIAVALLASGAILLESRASALSGAEFNPGRIIDDGVFYNRDSMSVDQIQQFLNAKVPTCDNWGTQPYAGTTRRAYSEARGIKFPLTCVKDYYENTSTHDNNLEGRSIPAGAKSAA